MTPPDRVDEGFDATFEAFRYLQVRVDALEEAAARRADPVLETLWLEEPPELGGWSTAIAAWVSPLDGELWHGECGRGSLALGLAAAGFTVHGVEPAGGRALDAGARGVRVEVAHVAARLAEAPSASVDALVLSGVVDRTPVDGLVALLDLVTDRLVPGGPLVVVGTDPATAAAERSVVAQDLLAARPLHADTWAYLLGRSGYTDVGPLEAGPDGAPGTYAVAGRRAR